MKGHACVAPGLRYVPTFPLVAGEPTGGEIGGAMNGENDWTGTGARMGPGVPMLPMLEVPMLPTPDLSMLPIPDERMVPIPDVAMLPIPDTVPLPQATPEALDEE